MIRTHNLGYPRIGEQRELKRATEAYWKGQISETDLLRIGAEIRRTNWLKQKHAGIDLIPINDFSFYDQTLDMSCLLGNIPPPIPGCRRADGRQYSLHGGPWHSWRSISGWEPKG